MISPLSEDRKYIRTSLMNSLLETLAYNLGHYNSDVNIYELSSVYFNDLPALLLGEGVFVGNKREDIKYSCEFKELAQFLNNTLM